MSGDDDRRRAWNEGDDQTDVKTQSSIVRRTGEYQKPDASASNSEEEARPRITTAGFKAVSRQTQSMDVPPTQKWLGQLRDLKRSGWIHLPPYRDHGVAFALVDNQILFAPAQGGQPAIDRVFLAQHPAIAREIHQLAVQSMEGTPGCLISCDDVSFEVTASLRHDMGQLLYRLIEQSASTYGRAGHGLKLSALKVPLPDSPILIPLDMLLPKPTPKPIAKPALPWFDQLCNVVEAAWVISASHHERPMLWATTESPDAPIPPALLEYRRMVLSKTASLNTQQTLWIASGVDGHWGVWLAPEHHLIARLHNHQLALFYSLVSKL